MADEGAWASTSYSNVQDGGSDGGSSRRRRKCVMGLVGLLLVGGIATGVALVVKKQNSDGPAKIYACTKERTCVELATSAAQEAETFDEPTCGGCSAAGKASTTWTCDNGEGQCLEVNNHDGTQGEFDSQDSCQDHCTEHQQQYKCAIPSEGGSETACVPAGNNGTFNSYGCDGTCDLPTEQIYRCDGGNCIETDHPGRHTFSSQDECQSSCTGPEQTYSCTSSHHRCELQPGQTGNFTSADCDGTCTSHTVQKYKCQGQQCVLDNEGKFEDSNCQDSCAPAFTYHCNQKGKCRKTTNCTGQNCFTDNSCDDTCQPDTDKTFATALNAESQEPRRDCTLPTGTSKLSTYRYLECSRDSATATFSMTVATLSNDYLQVRYGWSDGSSSCYWDNTHFSYSTGGMCI
jgi:hypothetical protein